MPAGNLKLFYAGQIDRVNPGVGADGVLWRMGYIGGEGLGVDFPGDSDYPDAEDQIPSLSLALTSVASGVKFAQNAANKKDARGWVYAALFGDPATTPAGDTPGRGPYTLAKIDCPERSLRFAISRANTDISAGVGDGNNLPQDV